MIGKVYLVKVESTGKKGPDYFEWKSTVGPYDGHGHTKAQAVAAAVNRVAQYIAAGDVPMAINIDWGDND